MRKQELVQLHLLCSRLRRYVERRYDLPDGAFERYDRVGVDPVAVYRKKAAHEEALDRLLSDLTAALPTDVDGSSESASPGTGPSGEKVTDRRTSREEVTDRRTSRKEVANRRG